MQGIGVKKNNIFIKKYLILYLKWYLPFGKVFEIVRVLIISFQINY
jgi:hypothetical protein